MGDVAGVAAIGDGPGQPIDEADASIQRGQDQGTQVGGDIAASEISADREAGSGRKAPLFCGNMRSRAGTDSHFLRTSFLITPIVSDT